MRAQRFPLLLLALVVMPALGEALGCRSSWVDLIPSLKPADLKLLPPRLRTLAEACLTSEVARNPARQEWLQQLRELLERASRPGG